MKSLVLILALLGASLFIHSCSSNTEVKESETEAKADVDIEAVVVEDPAPGLARPAHLTDFQFEKIKTIHKTFEEVFPTTLEKTIANFSSDTDIERELDIWMKMKDSFEFVNETKNFEKVEQRREAFALILMRTMASSEEVKKQVDLKDLTAEEIDFVLKDFSTRMAN